MLEFEWNPEKNKTNQRKHDGISFSDAIEVFYDDDAIVFDDPDHSIGEERFLIIGMNNKGICIVSHCYRKEKIRIISARKATKKEKNMYYEWR